MLSRVVHGLGRISKAHALLLCAFVNCEIAFALNSIEQIVEESKAKNGVAKAWETYSDWVDTPSIASCGASVSQEIVLNPYVFIESFSIGPPFLGVTIPVPNIRKYILSASSSGDEIKAIYYHRTENKRYCCYYYTYTDIIMLPFYYHGPFYYHDVLSHVNYIVPMALPREYCPDKPSKRPICTWPLDKTGLRVSPYDTEPCRHEAPLYKNGPVRVCPFPRYVMPPKVQDEEGYTACPLYHSPPGYSDSFN